MKYPDTALLMIDIQNDFCPGGALAVGGGDEIIPVVNQLQSDYGILVITQDWHPADHSSFAANHQNAEPFSMIEMPYGDQVLWPTHCVQGSEGARLHEELKTEKTDLIIRKGFRSQIDSYSAFFENDQQTKTGLHGYLRDRRVSQVALCGLATDFCVYYSAMDAVKSGFKVKLIDNACRAIDMDGSLASSMEAMKSAGIEIV